MTRFSGLKLSEIKIIFVQVRFSASVSARFLAVVILRLLRLAKLKNGARGIWLFWKIMPKVRRVVALEETFWDQIAKNLKYNRCEEQWETLNRNIYWKMAKEKREFLQFLHEKRLLFFWTFSDNLLPRYFVQGNFLVFRKNKCWSCSIIYYPEEFG